MNYEQAIEQLKQEIAIRGKFSIKNVPDYMLGLATTNKDQLQQLLNKFLEKQGVLTQEDEKAMQELLDKQKQNRKERTKIIVRDVLTGVLAVGGIVGVYFLVKTKRK